MHARGTYIVSSSLIVAYGERLALVDTYVDLMSRVVLSGKGAFLKVCK